MPEQTDSLRFFFRLKIDSTGQLSSLRHSDVNGKCVKRNQEGIVTRMSDTNPFEVLTADSQSEGVRPAEDYPGIGRLLWAVSGLLVFSGAVTLAWIGAANRLLAVGLSELIVTLPLLHLPFTVSRFRNMGYHWIRGLLVLIPIVNMGIAALCLTMPAGYADHRRFDTGARVGVIILLAGVTMLLSLVFFIPA